MLLVAAVPIGAVIASVEGGASHLGGVLRVTFVYLVLLLLFRVAGKRELARLSPLELVTLMLIPEIASPALHRGDDRVESAVVGICTLLTLVTATSLVSYLWPEARVALSGRPTVLVRRGTLLQDALARERIAPEEVYSAMHRAGLEHIEQVRWAILEPEGRVAIIAETDDDR